MTASTPHFSGWVAISPLDATRFASKISVRGKQAALGKKEWRQGRRHDHVRAVFPFSASVRHRAPAPAPRSEEHTSELQSLMRISYAVFCLKKQNIIVNTVTTRQTVTAS